MAESLSLDEFDAAIGGKQPRLPTIDDLKRAAVAKGINPDFAVSLLGQESGGNWNSKDSAKGARGGMQVMPGTFKAMMGNDGNPDDPWDNMEAGLRYVDYGRKTLGTDDPTLLAAGYHQGYDRPELKRGVIADTTDGAKRTRDYAREVTARMGINAAPPEDAPPANPAAKLFREWESQGLTPSGATAPVRGAVAATAPKADDGKGFLSRNLGYLKDDLKIGWNTLANAYDGFMASQYAELFEANKAKYGENPADPKVAENQAGLKASYDAHMADVAKRSEESAALQSQGRPETQQFLTGAKDKPFMEQAAILGEALAKNPVGVVTDLGIQSTPASLAMVATALLARFGLRSPGAAIGAGGATSATVEFGNDYASQRAQGVSHEDAWTAASIKSGVVGLFDAASMGSAGKALDEVLKAGFGQKLKIIGKELAGQAALGASGEALGSYASGRTPELSDVAAEAIGEMFGAPGEAVSTFGKKRDPQAKPGTSSTDALPATDVLDGVVDPAAAGATGTPGGPPPASATPPAPNALTTPAPTMDSLARVDMLDRKIAEMTALGPSDVNAEVLSALKAERDKIAMNWPAMTLGAAARFSTETGAELDSQYALVDADSLVASHDTNLRPNPAFPTELQPRDRERAASEVQVSGIVQKLNPARLGESADAGNGAPIIGADGLVESGNARTIALQRVYQANGQKAADYRTWLKENAARFGLTPEQVDAVGKPMLVRVRRTPVNRAEFARQANAPTTAVMSPLEMARSDAARIDSLADFAPNETGDFTSVDNRAFVRRFVGGLSATEQAGLVGADGQLSQSGYARIRNAVLARAYGDSPVLQRMVESLDNNMRNITGALVRVAPTVAKTRDAIASGAMFDSDITDNVVAAVEELSRLRTEGKSVGEFLAQSGMFGATLAPETAEILAFLDENIRSPKRIADFLAAALDILASAGGPNQGSLLGENTAPAKTDIINLAKERTKREQDRGAVRSGEAGAADGDAGGATRGGGDGEAGDTGNAATGTEGRVRLSRKAGDPGGSRPDEVTQAAPSSEGVVVSRERIAALLASDADWAMFPEDSGTLGIPRAEMPQIKGEHRGALIQFLAGRGINSSTLSVPADALRPTQVEFSPKKSNAWKAVREGSDRSVLASSDGYILDGHHQWVAALATGDVVKVIRFDAPIRELLNAAYKFPSVTRSEGANVTELRARARKDFKDALGDLAQIASRHTRAAMLPENTPGLMPTLVRLFDAGIKEVGYNLKDLVAYVKRALKEDAKFKALWNKIDEATYRKAAQTAMDQSTPADDLFGALGVRPVARDLFAAAVDQDAKPAAATIRGRPYDMKRDNFSPPDVSTFMDPAVVERADGYVDKYFKDRPPVQITDDERARAEALLLPIIEKAKAAKVEYDQKIINIAARTKALGQMIAPIKGMKRAVEKLVTDENFNTAGMKDMVRSTIVVSKYEDAQEVLDEITKEFEVLQIKNRSGTPLTGKNLKAAPRSDFGGYSDVLVNIVMGNGLIGEIQINVPSMLAAKDGQGHKLYEAAREAAKDSGLGQEIFRSMTEFYDAAFFAKNSGGSDRTQIPPRGSSRAGDSDSSSSDTLKTLPSGNSTNQSPPKVGTNLQPSGNLSGIFTASSVADGGGRAYTEDTKKSMGGRNGNPVSGSGRAGDAGQGAGAAPKPQATRQAGRVRGGPGGPDLFGALGGRDADPAGAETGRPAADATGARTEQRPGAGGGRGAGRVPRISKRRPINAKSGRNWRAGDADLTYEGSWLQKAQQNLDAVKLLRQLEAEKRQATPDEQRVLAKYVGWGASDIRNKIFTPRPWELTGAWKVLHDDLRGVLTDAEWKEAARSTQYAHYTSKPIVRAMWRAMERMGFSGGAVLEPGAGIGVFPGLMPGDIAAQSTYTGIEFEPLTGGILAQLFPDERVLVESFVDSKLPRDFYDVAIGNPPFAPTAILSDPEYRKQRFALHDYFFAKTLDRVRPGGLMVFVTSRYTMDKQGDKARAWLAERADLVGAIRLPQTAFEKNAGTEVVTDVIFLRKKVKGETWDKAQPWVGTTEITTAEGPAMVNQYFAAHPDMVLGTHSLRGSMYSKNEYTVMPHEGDIEALFNAAVDRLPEGALGANASAPSQEPSTNRIDWNPKAKKENAYYLADDGTLMQMSGGVGRPVPIRQGTTTKGFFPKHIAIIKSYVPLRDALKQAQYDQLTEGNWERSLAALRREYRAFVAKHGHLNQFTTYEVERQTEDGNGVATTETVQRYRYPMQSVLNDDPEWTLVMALEKVDEEKGAITEGAFLKERVLAPPARSEVKTPGDALLASLNDYGRLDLPSMAEAMHSTEEQLIEALGTSIYEDPSTGWTTSDDYLSGDVVQKLELATEAARSDKRFERNVEALRNVRPAAITHDQITASIGMNWIPTSDYVDFMREKLQANGTIRYVPATNAWFVDVRTASRSDFGTEQFPAYAILDTVLNAKPIEVWDTGTVDGKPTRTLNKEQTELALNKAVEMRAEFRNWLWQDAARAGRLQDIYNQNFNRLVPRSFDGRHLTLPGTSLKWNVHDHVKRGAWRIVQEGNTYLAHAVGAGKTFASIISAMEQKRLGLISKPMFVVPNHMLQQFAREFIDLYPRAQIMVADEREFHTDRRRAFVSRAALTNLDGVIITHSAFKLLDLDPDFKAKFVEEQLDDMRAALADAVGRTELERKNGKTVYSRDPTVRNIEQVIERLEQRLESMTQKGGKDQNARFDEMGVDFLYVDEAHEFRKLDFATARQVKGIDSKGSEKSFDLYMKSRWLEARRPGRSLVLMSGTPITNTMGEMYTVMRYLDSDTLRARGMEKFDAWAANYGEEATVLEPDAVGRYQQVTRFSQFVNVPELSRMFRRFADVLTGQELGRLLPDTRPKVAGGAIAPVITPLTPEFKAIRERLRERAEISRNWKPSFQQPTNPDPIIAIIGDGRLAAIDHRFMNPSAPDNPDSKLNRIIDGVIRVYNETSGMVFHDKAGKPEPIKGATQMVFADVGFGAGVAARRGFDARAWLKRRLAAAGIPANEIAFMSDYKAGAAKLKLFQDVNAGKVRVLVGSSKNMGTGVNAQQRLIALHHLDSPWYPADLEQREGRIIRQGNKNPVVQLYAYAMKGTYDEVMWQMVSRKQRFIDQALSGDASVRTIEDVSEASMMEQIAALTSGDPRALELAGLKADIERLYRLYHAHESDQSRLRMDREHARSMIEHYKKMIAKLAPLAAKVQDLSGENFAMTVGGEAYSKRKEAGTAVAARFKELRDAFTEGREKVGEVSGFPLMFSGAIFEKGGAKQYESEIYIDFGDAAPGQTVMVNPEADPVGLTMSIGHKLVELQRAPGEYKRVTAVQEAELRDIEPRIGAKFQHAEALAEKRRARDALEADMAANPSPEDDASPGGGSAAPPVLSRQADQPGPAPAGLSVSALRKAVAEILKTAKRLPSGGVRVVQNVTELPASLRDFLKSANAEDEVEGLYDPATKTVWLVADHLPTALRAEQVIFHELFGHFGLAGLFGKRMAAALRDLVARNKNLRKRAAELRAEYGYSDDLANEEAMVELAERGESFEGIRRMIAAVQSALRDMGLVRLADWMEGLTDAEAMTVLAEARRFVRGEVEAKAAGEAASGRLSRLGRVDVDGVRRPRTNSNGKPIAQDDESLRNFWRWFGDSKVVDEQGRPLVVYHGTAADFSEFDPEAEPYTYESDRGKQFFSGSPKAASDYAVGTSGEFGGSAGVMPVYLRMNNPRINEVDGNPSAWWDEQPSYAWRMDVTEDGRDGMIVRGDGESVFITTDPTQIKSATGNRGTFDPKNPDIRLARAATAQQASTILSTKRGRFTPLDSLTRLAVKATMLDRVTSGAYDRLLGLINRITPETVKAGVISDYGVPEAVIDRRIQMQGGVKAGFRQVGEVVAALGNLTRAESRVAYQWMNAADPQSSDHFMQQLPEDSIRVLSDVEKWVDKLSEEAVKLGLMTAEVRDRHRFAYLRRSYMKYEEDASSQDKARRKRAIAVLGDQYKGRGIVDSAPMSKIEAAAPTWWKRKLQGGKADKALRGEKFVRMEKRSGVNQASSPLPGMPAGAAKRKLLGVVYLPVGEPVPAQYAAWEYAGEWEVRDVKGGDAVMWRDFTAQEREQMGEIDEVRYAVARTLHGMIHDIEAARYLQWVSDNHSRATSAGIPADKIVDATESLRQAYAPDQWVQVPDSVIPKTGGVKRYGALAGRYLPAPIWNDIRQSVGPKQFIVGEWFQTMLRTWKVSKTALSPAVHTNNVMANVVMADWHDVTAPHIAKALEIMVSAKRSPAHQAIIDRFEDAGGTIGTWSLSELQREQLEPLLAQLKAQVSGGNGLIGAGAAIQLALSGKWKEAIAAATGSKAAVVTAKVGKALIDLYQAEDVVFRLAAFIKAKEDGQSDAQAAKAARNSFLDYQINAPWIQLMRQTAFPFVAFTYRAVPMLLETMARRPWKLLKLGLVLGGLNAIGYALSGGDEDKERKLLPEEKAGRTFGVLSPKLIRMPWNDANGSPVFLDVRRWIPVGDVLDMGQTHSAIPILPAAVPSGPLAVFAELAFNKSQFTGREITKGTDTGLVKALADLDAERIGVEQEAKVLDHLLKAFAPNIALLPGTYAFTGIMNASSGKTDGFGREQSVPQAVASALGVKVGSYPADVLLKNETAKRDGQLREIEQNISALRREYIKQGINGDEFQEKVAAQRRKEQKVNRDWREKVSP